MGVVLKIMAKDFKRRLKDPLCLLALLVFPLILAVIIGLAFSPMGKSILPTTELLIADQDQDWVSGIMSAALRQGRADMPPLDIREVDEAQGREIISQGKASALLIFPVNFTQDYLAGKATQLTLLKNPAQAFLPEIAEQYADVLALISSYVSQIFAQEMDSLNGMAAQGAIAPKLEWLMLGDGFYNKLKAAEKYLYPIPITVQESGPNSQAGGAQSQTRAVSAQPKPVQPPAKQSHFVVMEYILPGLSLFGIFFVGQVVLLDIFSERSKHTMARLFTAPVTVTAFLAGKTLGGFVISLLSLILLQVLGSLAFGVDWGPPGLILLVNVIAVLGITGLCLLVFCVARTQAQAGAILSAVILSMSLFGGSFVPLMMLPPIFRWISLFTLNSHLVEAYYRVMYWHNLSTVSYGLSGVALFGLLSMVIGMIFLRRRIERGL
jgi:ABC-2 type transport system permease protein